MLIRRVLFSTAACLIAAAVLADEPECAVNFKADATSSETSVITVLTPRAVVEALPRKLAAAGASMEWAQPAKGIIKAGSLDVKAEASGNVTRVIFHTSPAADKTTLCRYATLVGNPPLPPAPPVPQDPALIAQMKGDLLIKHMIEQPEIGHGLNHAVFRSLDDFLKFEITSIKDVSNDTREYGVSMLLPRETVGIAREDGEDISVMMNGHDIKARTKPAHAEATIVYTRSGAAWKLTNAFITHIESVK
jgi:hypothetical protein